MKNIACESREMQLMDLALGYLSESESKDLTFHMKNCPRCSSLFKEMASITQQTGQQAPPEHLKQRMMNTVAGTGSKTKAFKFHLRSPYVVSTMGVCVMLLFLWVIPLLGSQTLQPQEGRPAPQATAVHPPEAATGLQRQDAAPTAMVNHPQTVQYTVKKKFVAVPNVINLLHTNNLTNINNLANTLNAPVTADVWYNRLSGEILLVVNGLSPLPDSEYRAWFVSPGQMENAGILQVAARKGELYYRSQNRREMKALWITIEPAGGISYPSGQAILRIDIE